MCSALHGGGHAPSPREEANLADLLRDIEAMLERRCPVDSLLRRKLRRAATGFTRPGSRSVRMSHMTPIFTRAEWWWDRLRATEMRYILTAYLDFSFISLFL